MDLRNRSALRGITFTTLVAIAGILGIALRSAQSQTAKTKPQAVTPPPAIAAPPQQPAQDDSLDGLDFSELVKTEKTGIVIIHNWVYTRRDMVVKGAYAIFDEKKDTLDSDQPVEMDDKKYHLTADSVHIENVDKNPDKRNVTLKGHAIMVMKPTEPEPPANKAPQQPQGPPAAAAAQPAPAQPKPGADDKNKKDINDARKHGGTAYCDNIVYKPHDKYSILTGHVVFKQNFTEKDSEKNTNKQIERTLTCEHAENDGKANQLHFFKPVHFESNQDQKLDTSEDVLIGTKEGEETLSMRKGKIVFKREDEDEDSKPADTGKGEKKKP